MKLTLSPQMGLPGAAETTVHVSGDIITIDGVDHDLSPVPEGGEATVEGDSPFAGTITRQGGVLHVAVRIVLGEDADPVQPDDAAHWTLPDASGEVDIPAIRKPVAQEPA